jgi:hypothetical protein
MVRILCHGASQKSEIFKIEPTKSGIKDEFVFYLKKCAICENPVLQILRIDIWGNVLEPVRLKTRNIEKFLNSMSVIWKPQKLNLSSQAHSDFYLEYNEYGIKKRCYQNLSSVKLGKIETDIYKDLIGRQK